MGKLLEMQFCQYCRHPVSSNSVRDFGWFQLSLCTQCYEQFMDTLHGKQ